MAPHTPNAAFHDKTLAERVGKKGEMNRSMVDTWLSGTSPSFSEIEILRYFKYQRCGKTYQECIDDVYSYNV